MNAMKQLMLIMLFAFFQGLTFAQKNFIDQPYIETSAKVDTLVVPDEIYMSILLDEADSKNKKSVEEQEKLLETTLKALGISSEKNLSLLNFSSDFKKYFLKSQSVIKSKMYVLLVGDAIMAGRVLSELENVGISNVSIERTEYSKAESLILELKAKAIEKSKITAIALVRPLNQKVGKALYISDVSTISNILQGKSPGIQIRGMSSLYGSRAADPVYTEFQKVRFEVQVNIKYQLD